MTKPDILLWLDGARGQYIPRDFACSFNDRTKHVTGVSDHDWKVLEAGPDHGWYWSAWDDVCTNARVTMHGIVYTVYQDMDCWLVPCGMVWDYQQEFFVWEQD